ncbi:MAG: hypothetical protein AAF383_25170, partial [Cyanobacteria bacterium P01_A01_bin.83]
MNPWKIIWQSYHNTATFSKIFTDILKRATWFDRFFLILCIIGMFGSLLLDLIFDKKFWSLLLLCVSEVSLLFKFGNLKRNLVLLEYGDP